jgi:hypothetical protein
MPEVRQRQLACRADLLVWAHVLTKFDPLCDHPCLSVEWLCGVIDASLFAADHRCADHSGGAQIDPGCIYFEIITFFIGYDEGRAFNVQLVPKPLDCEIIHALLWFGYRGFYVHLNPPQLACIPLRYVRNHSMGHGTNHVPCVASHVHNLSCCMNLFQSISIVSYQSSFLCRIQGTQ